MFGIILQISTQELLHKIYKIHRHTLNSLMYMVRISRVYKISLLYQMTSVHVYTIIHHLLIPYKELVVKDPRTSLSSVKPTGEHTIITTTL